MQSIAAFDSRKILLQASQLKHGVSIVADLTKEEDMKRAIQEAVEKLGGLDILVNRQGQSRFIIPNL